MFLKPHLFNLWNISNDFKSKKYNYIEYNMQHRHRHCNSKEYGRRNLIQKLIDKDLNP